MQKSEIKVLKVSTKKQESVEANSEESEESPVTPQHLS